MAHTEGLPQHSRHVCCGCCVLVQASCTACLPCLLRLLLQAATWQHCLVSCVCSAAVCGQAVDRGLPIAGRAPAGCAAISPGA
jgi:hypothetical protein